MVVGGEVVLVKVVVVVLVEVEVGTTEVEVAHEVLDVLCAGRVDALGIGDPPTPREATVASTARIADLTMNPWTWSS